MEAIRIIALLSLIGTFAQAEDDVDMETMGRVAWVDAGETAPYSGVLYDEIASASLLARLNTAEEACAIEIERQVGIATTNMQLKLDILDAQYQGLKLRTEAQIAARDDIIKLQQDQLSRIRKPKGELLFAAGVGSGIVLTVLSAWAIGQAASAANN